MLHNSLQTCVR
jgi:hypothetical protein